MGGEGRKGPAPNNIGNVMTKIKQGGGMRVGGEGRKGPSPDDIRNAMTEIKQWGNESGGRREERP